MRAFYFGIFILYVAYLFSIHDNAFSQETGDAGGEGDGGDDNGNSDGDGQAANNESELVKYDPTLSYCFRFTWMGPEYDNQSVAEGFNDTCQDLKSNKRFIGVPCRMPLVVTFDGTQPDLNYMFENHRENVICRRASGFVCAKYTYSFAGKVQNMTHMCTRVYEKNKGPITDGCYKYKQNGIDISLCVCESQPGLMMPCNGTGTLQITFSLLLACLLFTVLRGFMCNR